MRGDVISRFESELSENGFKYLLKNGRYYSNAHYIHAITKTGPGHATLSTGSTPSLHGIVGNDWFDQASEKSVYTCYDSTVHAVGDVKSAPGNSPHFIMASTAGDELYNYTNGEAKVFGISIKDRGAIMMAGHKGKAIWYSKKNGKFVSSSYYYNQLPEWLTKFNNKNLIDYYYEHGWELMQPFDKYKSNFETSEKFIKLLKTKDISFPRNFENISKEKLMSILPYTPWGDIYTGELAKELIRNEGIGKDDVTDYLSISFSCTDYIGHLVGLNAIEYENQILNLDNVLAQLFKFIDETVGLENTLIVLSGDHGACESPEFLQSKGVSTGVLSVRDIETAVNDYMKSNYSLRKNVVRRVMTPYLYLDEKLIAEAGLSVDKVETKLAEIGGKVEGVYKIFTAHELRAGTAEGKFKDMVKASFFEGRSGNLYVIPLRNWYPAYNGANRGNAATHGTPWDYDTFVPIIFSGPGVIHGKFEDTVGPHDIAPTITNYLGIPKPDKAVGKPLL